jgi:glycyl-tRNA synthetase beta chain
LSTKCVAELPELQGIVGGYYAKIQGEDELISEAICEQYLPVGPNSEIPKTPLGSLLALCDKIDTICGLFLVAQKPTGSKDPLALRRAALGVVRIIIHNNISAPLRIIVEKSIGVFPLKVLKDCYPMKNNKELKILRSKVLFEVIEFIVERIKSILRDSFDVRTDVANVLLDDYLCKIKEDKKFDINKLVNKAKFINSFVVSESSDDIIALYKRAVNIVSIEEKKDGKKFVSKPHFLTMKDSYEKALYKKVKQVSSRARKLGKVGDYGEVFKLFEELKDPLNNFFDNVKVNAEDSHVRENRLLILGQLKVLFNGIFNFSKIDK